MILNWLLIENKIESSLMKMKDLRINILEEKSNTCTKQWYQCTPGCDRVTNQMRDKGEMCNTCSRERPKTGGKEKIVLLLAGCCVVVFVFVFVFFPYPFSWWAEDGHPTASKFTHYGWNHRECLFRMVMTTKSQQRKWPVWFRSGVHPCTSQLWPGPVSDPWLPVDHIGRGINS